MPEPGVIQRPRDGPAPSVGRPDPADRAWLGVAALPERRRRAAAADAMQLTLATYGAQALLLVAGLAQKGIVGPVATGFWSLMQTFWVLLTIAPLGALHGATRQIPIRRGRGDLAGAGAAAATGSSFSLTAIAGAGAVVAATALIFGGSWPDEMRYGLMLLGITAPLRLLCDCHEVIFQATKRFDIVSLSTLLEAVLAVTVGILLVWWLGYYGLFAAVIASNLIMLAFWTARGVTGRRRPAFVWRIDRRLLRELLRFGAPMLLQGQIWLLFLTVDNLIVAALLGVRDLGYYALAVSVTSYILILPRVIGTALFPRMTERYGQTGDIASVRPYAIAVQRLLAYALLPAVVGAAYVGVPVLIQHALPDFEPAIPAVRIMVAGTFFLALTNMPTKVLITAGYRWNLAAVLVGCLVFNALANILVVGVLDGGLEGAAIATSASYAFAFVAMTGYALLQIERRGAIAHVAELSLVVGYVMAGLWGIEWLIGPGDGSLANDLVVALAKLALLTAILVPVLGLAEIRHQVLSGAWGRMRHRAVSA